jgi:hypothetical protein
MDLSEAYELTEEDMKHFRPAREVLPELFGAELAAKMLSTKNDSLPDVKQTALAA